MKRILTATACVLGAAIATAAPRVTRLAASSADASHLSASWRIDFDPPSVSIDGDRCDVSLDGCEPLLVAGHPALPAFGFGFMIPADASLQSLSVRHDGEPQGIDLPHPLRHIPNQVPLSDDEPHLPQGESNASIYSLDTAWPPLDPPRYRTDGTAQGIRASLTLFPLQYIPSASRLLCHKALIVTASWRIDPTPVQSARAPSRIATKGAVPRSGTPSPLPDGPVDYLIISTTSLVNDTPAPYNLQGLCAAREAQGYSTALVEKSWIYANYDGRDNQERIRNFVIDARRNHGLKYLVMAASCRPLLLPMRKLYTEFSSGPKTYSESIASDVYFGCLDGDFDSDGDGMFGEIGDGENGGDIDLVAEVFVGRIPVSTPAEVTNFVAKILRYEAASSNEVASAAFVGEHLGFGGVSEFAWPALEQIRLGGIYDNYATLGFANSRYASRIDHSTTLYDMEDSPAWSRQDIIGLLNRGPRLINHFGHGKVYYGDKDKKTIMHECMKIALSTNDTATIPSITNDVGFVLYSQACDAASIDKYTDTWVEQMLTSPHACVAAIANTRSGFGTENSTDGGSHRLHRRFIDELLSDRAMTIGEAFVQSRESLVAQIPPDEGNVLRWCYYSCNLFGDPAMPVAARLRLSPPTIDHSRLATRQPEATPCSIDATFGPAGLLDMQSPVLIWRVENGAPQTNALARVSRCDYSGAIPAQPQGTRIYYRLEARTIAGVAASHPSDGSWHQFTFSSSPATDGTFIFIK